MSYIGTLLNHPMHSSEEKYPKDEVTIIKLKFLGKLKEGNKFNSNKLYIEEPSIYSSYKRWSESQSRKTELDFSYTTIDDTLILLEQRINEGISCANLIEDLYRAIDGIRELKKTYANDTIFGCCIDTLIDYHITMKLDKLKKAHPTIFPVEIKKQNVKEKDDDM